MLHGFGSCCHVQLDRLSVVVHWLHALRASKEAHLDALEVVFMMKLQRQQLASQCSEEPCN